MSRPKFVILEYGVAEGTTNPFGYDPWIIFNQPKVPLSDYDYSYADMPMAIRSTRHMSEIVGVINKYKKFDFEIVSLQYQYAEQYLDANKDSIFVVSASVGSFFNDNFMAKYKDNFYMCISAGNEGVQGEGVGSEKPYWTSIGAVNTDMSPADYSSYGKGLVKFVGIAGEETPYTYFGQQSRIMHGTSFACPQHGTQIMNMMCAMYEKLGGFRKPTIKEVLATRDKYCTDVYEIGKDLCTGFGYYGYKEGELTMSKIVKMTVGLKEYTVDGVVKTMDSPPILVDGRVYVPLRVAGESLGATVGWDSVKKEVTITL